MSTGVSTVSPTLLTLVLIILSPIHGKDIGERCMINNPNGPSTSGSCKLLQNCPSVYEELLAGKTPETSCGFLGFQPIVCCPKDNVTITTSTTLRPTERISTPRVLIFNNTRGSLARAKCAENAEAVFGLEILPVLLPNQPLLNISRCAVKSRKLIVGGKKADPREFPHMTAIGYDGGENGILWLCGGSLISERVILTAAHCLDSNWGTAEWALIGDLNLKLTNDDAQPQMIRIVERIPHPDYKSPSAYHDIAVMKLETSVTYTAWVRPACLPIDLPDVGYDNKAVATGWGRVEWGKIMKEDSYNI